MKKRIAILMSLILSIFLVVGCGKPKGPKDYVNDYFENIKTQVESEFVKKIIGAQMSDKDLPDEVGDAMIDMIEKLEVTPESEKIDGDTATVNVKVKGVSFKTVFKDFMAKLMTEAMTNENVATMSDEEAEKLVCDIIIKAMNEAPVEERTGIINLTKSGEEWKVKEDDSLIEAVWGITESDVDALLNY